MTKLLPKYSPILITLINGIYDASMAMVSVPVKLYESGFSYASVISIYFGSAVFFLLRIVFESHESHGTTFRFPSFPVFFRYFTGLFPFRLFEGFRKLVQDRYFYYR